MSMKDFRELLAASVNEYTRRGYSTSGVTTGYEKEPDFGTAIFVQHSKGFLSNLNTFPGSGKNYQLSTDSIVKTTDMFDAIMYTRQLMNSVVPR